MKISVIIVTFNGIKWIENCINSILGSTLLPEIIIVDNCSSDHTVELIKKKNSNYITILEQDENFGFGVANNIGIAYAMKNDADYVFLLNQDVCIEADTIEQLLRVAKENSNLGILSPIHLNGVGNAIDQSFQFYISRPSAEEFISDAIVGHFKKSAYEVDMVNAAAWMVPKLTLEIVGGFDPMFFLYGEDDNYCQRVLYHNLKIGIVPSTKIKHDSDNNNFEVITGSVKYYEKFLNRIKVQFGNVNTNDFKKIRKIKFYFFKETILSFLRLDFFEAEINWKKFNIIFNLKFKKNVLKNREIFPNYLEL